MNVLVAVAIAPFGVGEELAPYVSQAVKVIRDSGLPNRTYSMFTEIEGEYDEVMQVVKDATFVLAEAGIRTEVILKADIRPGFTDTMNTKVQKVDDILGDGAGEAGAGRAVGAAVGVARCAPAAGASGAPAAAGAAGAAGGAPEAHRCCGRAAARHNGPRRCCHGEER